jgi:uncharacterized membrane protein
MSDENNKPKGLKVLAIAMLIVSFLGFIDAAYLTVTHYLNANVPCTITHGCDVVLKSEYSTMAGIPVVILGVLYYLTIFLGAYFYLEYRSRIYFKITAAMTLLGFLFSAWFVYVQLGILHAICQYCMLSATTSTILFGLGIATWINLKVKNRVQQ